MAETIEPARLRRLYRAFALAASALIAGYCGAAHWHATSFAFGWVSLWLIYAAAGDD